MQKGLIKLKAEAQAWINKNLSWSLVNLENKKLNARFEARVSLFRKIE